MLKKILILANNNEFSTWPEKITEIKAFYSTLAIKLDFLIINTEYKNVPVVDMIMNGGNQNGPYSAPFEAYAVDPVWFEKNPDVLTGGSFDCVIFALNKTDVAPATNLVPAGINTGTFNGVDQITVFIDPGSENWPAQQNGVPVGNAIAYIIEHELSHWLYNMLKLPVDNTHKYFYSSNPKGVIAELSAALNTMQNEQTPSSIAIYNAAKGDLGKSLVAANVDPEVGCMSSVSTLYSSVFPNHADILNTASTSLGLEAFSAHPALFKEVQATDALPGDFMICATGSSTIADTPIKNGHTGILGNEGVMSNNSDTGLWSENYTLVTWKQRYETEGGYVTRYFRAI